MKKRAKIQYFGACEGLQEIKYFKRLQFLLNSDENREFDVNFNFENTNGGGIVELCKQATKKIRFIDLDQAKKKEKIVAIFDYDFRDNEFKRAISFCNKEKVVAAYSNVNFELWLILHRENYQGKISNTNGYHKKLRKIYDLNQKEDIKNEKVIDKILTQIDLDDVKKAIKHAKELEKNSKSANDIYDGMSGHFNQPYLRIYEFIENILSKLKI